jgi:hypothetical protein
MVRNSSNNRHLERLEQLFQSSMDDRYAPIDPDDLAIIEEARNVIGGPDDDGPPRSREFFELAIARALEKRGRTTSEIAEKIATDLAAFGEWGRDKRMGAID